MSPLVLLILFGTALLAGFVDTIAGGGGLITIPVLLLAQVPPIHALATNKLQGSFGTLAAATSMLSRGLVRWPDVRTSCLCAFAGACAGAAVIQFVDARALDAVVPVVLIAIAAYFLFAPKAGDVARSPRVGDRTYRATVVPGIGFYDGVFGPGTGSFFALAGVFFRGHDLVTATAHAKVFNFSTNLASLIVFVLGGKVLWLIGGVMAVGQIIGAYFGSIAVHRGGAKLIRHVVVIVSVAMVINYLWRKGWL